MEQNKDKFTNQKSFVTGQTEDEKEFARFKRRQSPRRAKKYVFFEVASGKIALEYGGVKPPMRVYNPGGEEIEVFELGCLVKEIREEAFQPHICFYVAGDFMDP